MMQGSADHLPQLITIVSLVFVAVSSSSDCTRFRTGTLNKYLYLMGELAADVNSFNFSVKVMNYAYITLSPVAKDTDSQYEIAIGNSEKANTAAIRRCRRCEDTDSVTTQYRLLEYNQFKTFWVNFESGTIQIGRYNETAFLSWTDSNPLNIRYIGMATLRLPGYFTFCDIKFKTNQAIPVEGIFVLCILFLPAMLMLTRAYLKHLKRKIAYSRESVNDDETELNDAVDTRGIENPAGPLPDPDPPSYDKCMEFPCGSELLHSVDEVASSSCDVEYYNSDLPPSYEAAMAYCLFDISSDSQSDVNRYQCSISSAWDAGDADKNNDDLETSV